MKSTPFGLFYLPIVLQVNRLSLHSVLLACLLTLTLPAVALAQKEDEDDSVVKTPRSKASLPDRPADYRSTWGILGNVHAGITFGFMSNIEKDLQAEQLFSEDYYLRSLCTHYGGSIMGLIKNRFIIGLGGSGYNFDASLASFPPKDPERPLPEEEPGEARIRAHYLFGKLGYAVFNKSRWVYDEELDDYEFKYQWLLFPYVGFGFGGKITMEISNYGTKDLAFGAKDDNPGIIIPRSEVREFTSPFSVLEIGVGSRFMRSPRGGLTAGLDLGLYLNMGSNQWEGPNSVKVEQANKASISGLYLRATLGGGLLGGVTGGPSRSGNDGYIAPSRNESKGDVLEEEPKPKKVKRKKEVEPSEP
jgi:hypothetical protein